MKEAFKKVLPLVGSMALLAACGNGGNKASQAKEAKGEEGKIHFVNKVEHEGKPIKGGEFRYAIASDDPIKGLFNPALAQDANDQEVVNLMFDDVFTVDSNNHFTNNGLAKYKVDKDARTVTVTFPKDAKWSDGQPLTVDDYIFTHEFIAHPKYPGVRYPSSVGPIEGAEEYHAGKSDHISGIEKKDDRTVVLHYKEMNPSIEIAGGSLLSYIIPKHVYEKIPMDKVMSDDASRKNIVGNGPFKIQSVIPGESVTLVANEHFYKGRPKLDKVTVDVVSSKNIISEMKNGNYDVASMPSDQYDAYKDASNFTVLGQSGYSYSYIGFKLGKWNNEKQINEMDPNSKVADKKVRQAMAYAIDNAQIAEKFYKGTRFEANSLIPPVFKEHNKETPAYSYNPKKAKKLLDEAGYKDKDGDGFREDPNGKPFVLKYATMAGGQNDQTLALAYLQFWQKVGLKVELTTGRPIEFNSFYDKVEHDDPEINLYMASWSTGTDPDPSGLYGEKEKFNMARYVSDENTKLLKDIASEKSFDPEFRQKAFDKWQDFAHDEAFVIPTLFRTSIVAVNKRVKYYDLVPGTEDTKARMYNIQLTKTKPVGE